MYNSIQRYRKPGAGKPGLDLSSACASCYEQHRPLSFEYRYRVLDDVVVVYSGPYIYFEGSMWLF